MVSADMEKVSVTGPALVYAPVNQLATLIVHNVVNEDDIAIVIKGKRDLYIVSTGFNSIVSSS